MTPRSEVSEEQREKFQKYVFVSLLPYWAAQHRTADHIAGLIASDPQRFIGALVAAGVLEVYTFSDYPLPLYSVVTPKRVVRAGYRKLSDGTWIPTCSEHPETRDLPRVALAVGCPRDGSSLLPLPC